MPSLACLQAVFMSAEDPATRSHAFVRYCRANEASARFHFGGGVAGSVASCIGDHWAYALCLDVPEPCPSYLARERAPLVPQPVGYSRIPGFASCN